MDVDFNNGAKEGYIEGFELALGTVSLDTAMVCYDYYMAEAKDHADVRPSHSALKFRFNLSS